MKQFALYAQVRQIVKGSYGKIRLMHATVTNNFFVAKLIEMKTEDHSAKIIADREAK
jgi:hypothetical protein